MMRLLSSIIIILFSTFYFNVNAQVSGVIFQDFNANGNYDTAAGHVEVPYEGVTVTAFDPSGAVVGTAVSDATGAYTISGVSGPLRVEFTWTESWLEPSASGGTTVQFVNGGDSNVDLAVNYPSDFCQENPFIVTNCYVNGAVTAADDDDVFIRWSYDNSGFADLDKISIASKDEIGSTWGIAYARESETLYTSAFLKRHVGIPDNDGDGMSDLGAIYELDENGNAVLWLDVTTLGVNVGTIGDDAARELTCTTCPSTDIVAFNDVGELGIGDLDINDDETELYFTNLSDGMLYTIDIATKSLVGSGVLVPQTQCAVAGDARPFALNYYKGNLYVGTVCSAASTDNDAELEATVYVYDGSTFSEVINYPLDYDRGIANSQCPTFSGWFAWTETWPSNCTNTGADRTSYPQPMFGDIEFIYRDGQELMVMSLLDRWGHQIGAENYDNTGQGEFDGVSAGDILIAEFDIATQTAVLENGGSVGGSTPSTQQANGNGPGDGEYYWGEALINDSGNPSGHLESVVGGLLYLPGTEEVAVTAFDPNNIDPSGQGNGLQVFDTGGVIFLDNNDGGKEDAFRIYVGVSGFSGGALFDKAAGLGDLEAICDPAPVEIGNLVWNDLDGDGIQDADEAGIPGVTVELYDPATSMVIATATTDANGNYIFSTGDGTDSGSNQYGLALDFGATYEVRIVDAEGASQQTPLSGLEITSVDSDGTTNGDARDSDGSDSDISTVSFTLGAPGENDHTYDFGFRLMPVEPCMISSIAITSNTCVDNSTNDNPADDRVRVGILVQGTGTASNYTVSVDNGTTISPMTGVYGTASFFELGPGTAGSGNMYTITVTDTDDPLCTTSILVTAPDNCSPVTPCESDDCFGVEVEVNDN